MTERPSLVTRRRTLRLAAVVGVTSSAGCAAGGTQTGGDETAESPYGGWLDPVENFDGTPVDRTADDTVTVSVGAGNGLLFAPPAVQITPGTTVVWEWTGRGGQHNVEADTGAFESELASAEGTTFEWTFDDSGVVPYFCEPHQAVGMKGVVDVVDG